MTARSFFYRETDGIRVTVRPVYLRDHSEPSQSHYVFAYFVRIENVGKLAAQLLTRRWLIHDSVGDGVDTEGIGEGLGGEQPTDMPAAAHEAQGFGRLTTGEGPMEGHPVDRIPLQKLIGPALLVSFDDSVMSIGVNELTPRPIKGHKRVLFRTRNSALLSQREFVKNYTFVAPEGAQYLVDSGVELV